MQVSVVNNIFYVNLNNKKTANKRHLSFGSDVFVKNNTFPTQASQVPFQIQKDYAEHKNIAKIKQNIPYYDIVDENLHKNLPQILDNLWRTTDKIPPFQQKEFFDVVNQIVLPDHPIRSFDFSPMAKSGLDLFYPRVEFVRNLSEVLKEMPVSEQENLKSYYEFDLPVNQFGIHLEGYPLLKNNTNALQTPIDEEIQSFTQNNEVKIKGQPELSGQFSTITRIMPEWLFIIGKKQHKVQDYTVDIHTLKVLQGVLNNSQFEKLSPSQKRILFMSVMLHDIAKRENVGNEDLPDQGHARKSGFDTYFILKKFDMPRDEKNAIFEIVYNHDWLQKYTNTNEPEQVLLNISRRFSNVDNFVMSSILTNADLRGVKANNIFYDRFSPALEEATEKITNIMADVK